jgi:RimJ/RimL family protein N-acetyltransferase
MTETSVPSRAAEGWRVTLRPLDAGDRVRIRRWMADPDVVSFTVLVPSPQAAMSVPYGREAADRYLDALLSDPLRRSYAIEVDGQHIGNVGLKDIDLSHGTAECFVEIGETWARGKGFARRAMSALLVEAFADLDLDEVTLGVFEFNHAAIALYLRLGFSAAGLYGWHWAQERYFAVHKMRILRAAYRGVVVR